MVSRIAGDEDGRDDQARRTLRPRQVDPEMALTARQARFWMFVFGGLSVCDAVLSCIDSPHWFWVLSLILLSAVIVCFGSMRFYRDAVRRRQGRPTPHEPQWARLVRAALASSGVFVANAISGSVQVAVLGLGSWVFAFATGVCVVNLEMAAVSSRRHS